MVDTLSTISRLRGLNQIPANSRYSPIESIRKTLEHKIIAAQPLHQALEVFLKSLDDLFKLDLGDSQESVLAENIRKNFWAVRTAMEKAITQEDTQSDIRMIDNLLQPFEEIFPSIFRRLKNFIKDPERDFSKMDEKYQNQMLRSLDRIEEWLNSLQHEDLRSLVQATLEELIHRSESKFIELLFHINTLRKKIGTGDEHSIQAELTRQIHMAKARLGNNPIAILQYLSTTFLPDDGFTAATLTNQNEPTSNTQTLLEKMIEDMFAT